MENSKTLHTNKRNTGKQHTNDIPIFRERLEKLRIENGFKTQREFARAIGCSLSTYQSWINPKYQAYKDGYAFVTPGIDMAMKICDICHVSLDYLFGRTDYTTVTNENISDITGLNDNAINCLIDNKKKENKTIPYILNILMDGNTDILDSLFNYIVSDYAFYADNDGNPQSSSLPLLNNNYLQVNAIDVKQLNGALLQNITEKIVELKNKYKTHFTFQPQPIEFYLNKIIKNKEIIEQWKNEIQNYISQNNFEPLQTIYGAIGIRNDKIHLYKQIILCNYIDILKAKNFKNFTIEQQNILNEIYTENDYTILNIL